MKPIIMAFLAFAALGLAGPATAQTVGYADAIKILSASCGKDIDKYCSKANLGNNEVGRCLDKNESKLSAQCKTDRARVGAMLEARFVAQQNVAKICERDIFARCRQVPEGKGNVLRCMLKAQKTVSKKCNQAIDDAGFR